MLHVTRERNFTGKGNQSGFTLIEALAAAMILAIGILGIVSLLTLSKVSQHEGMQRARAVALADDILERIRRNPEGLATYDIGLADPLGNGSITSEPTPDCGSESCNAIQLATHDLWNWEQLLDGSSATVSDGGTTTNTDGLRNIRACIEFTADAGKTNTGIVDIVLQWQGLKETTDAVATGGTICGDAADEDTTRRQVVVSTYVIDEAELL